MAKERTTAPKGAEEVAPVTKSGAKYVKTIPNTLDLYGFIVTEETFSVPQLDEQQDKAFKNALASGIIKEA